MSEETEKELFTMKEAAKYAGYSRSWLRKLYDRGVVPAERIGHTLFFTRTDLDKLRVRRGLEKHPTLLTGNEAAAYLKMSADLFHWWRYHPNPALRPVPEARYGRFYTFSKKELNRWHNKVFKRQPSGQRVSQEKSEPVTT